MWSNKKNVLKKFSERTEFLEMYIKYTCLTLEFKKKLEYDNLHIWAFCYYVCYRWVMTRGNQTTKGTESWGY